MQKVFDPSDIFRHFLSDLFQVYSISSIMIIVIMIQLRFDHKIILHKKKQFCLTQYIQTKYRYSPILSVSNSNTDAKQQTTKRVKVIKYHKTNLHPFVSWNSFVFSYILLLNLYLCL